MRANTYTGHGANTGGLQRHSIGELYPFDVYGQETAEGTRYGVVNLSTGDETGALWTVHGATATARALKAERDAAELSRAATKYWRAERTKKVREAKAADKRKVAQWIASGKTPRDLDDAREWDTRAGRIFALLWGWSAPRHAGTIGRAHDVLWERDRFAYFRRLDRVRRVVSALRHSAAAYEGARE